MKKSEIAGRRQFVKIAIGTLATIPVLLTTTASADDHAEQPMLAEDDAQAAALGYVADSATVDAAKYPNHGAAQLCTNCALYQGAADSESGACAIFPGKLVAGAGWCAAYAAKPE